MRNRKRQMIFPWPMRCDGFAFTDVVVRRPVFYFTDRRGRRWLAFHRWSWFRVKLFAARNAAPKAEE